MPSSTPVQNRSRTLVVGRSRLAENQSAPQEADHQTTPNTCCIANCVGQDHHCEEEGKSPSCIDDPRN